MGNRGKTMGKNLVTLLKDLKNKLEKIPVKDGKKIRYVKELNELIELYSKLEITTEYSEKYNNIIKQATVLNEGENYRNIKKIEKLLGVSYYVYYEIKGEVYVIMKKLSYSFIITCILFLFVAFPVLPPLITVLFIAPMYMGVRGLSKRLATGLTLGMSVIEFSSLVSIMTMVLLIQALPRYNNFINELITKYSNKNITISTTSMNIIVIIYCICTISLAVTSIYNIYHYYKYKKIFV
jgi:hypothetical protein